MGRQYRTHQPIEGHIIPQPKTPGGLRDAIYAMLGQLPDTKPPYTTLKAPQVHRELALQADQLSQHGWKVPSERTIRRVIQDFGALTGAQRRPYQLAAWPDSFTAEALPWEAAGALFELHRHIGRRPTVRFASWFWHVTATAPGCPLDDRAKLAQMLAARAARGELSGADARAAETWLAYRMWEPGSADALNAAVEGGDIPRPAGDLWDVMVTAGRYDWSGEGAWPALLRAWGFEVKRVPRRERKPSSEPPVRGPRTVNLSKGADFGTQA